MKTCNKCGVEKPLNSYTIKNKTTGNRETRCRECRNQYSKEHAKKPEVSAKRREQKRIYWECRKSEIQPRRTIYMREKRQSDPQARIANVMRTTLSYLITGKIKETTKDIGCSSSEFKLHLSSLFSAGMTWENYGEWEIDHISPVANFNQQDKEDFKKCWHYSNLQPLWKSENRKKSTGVLQ